MNKEEFDYEYSKNAFVQNIDDSYTLNLAMSILEDKQSLIYDNLVLSQNNTNLKQALNEIKKIINDCKRLMPHEFDWEEQIDIILDKIDKVLGEENVKDKR